MPQDGDLVPRIFASFTYGAAGPVGAHPVTRVVPAADGADRRCAASSALPGGTSLQDALDDLDIATQPVVIEIRRQPGAPHRPRRRAGHARSTAASRCGWRSR